MLAFLIEEMTSYTSTMTYDEWNLAVLTEFSVLILAANAVLELSPPDTVKDVHGPVVKSAQFVKDGVKAYKAGMIDSIDSFELESGTGLFQLATAEVNMASLEVATFCD